jgi:hypothetical protein
MADKKKEEQEIQGIFDDTRSFIHEGEKYFIDNADIDSVRQADWHYSKTYNEALLAGVTTAAQMEDILEERGITGKVYDDKRIALLTDLDTKIAELGAATSIDEKKALAQEVEATRNKLFRHNQRASSPRSQTVENISDDARVEFLTAAMIKDSAGERVWTSYEDYKTTKKVTLAYRARYEVMLYLQGLRSDFLSQTPEAIAMKEIEEAENTLLSEKEEVKVTDEEKLVIEKKKKK